MNKKIISMAAATLLLSMGAAHAQIIPGGSNSNATANTSSNSSSSSQGGTGIGGAGGSASVSGVSAGGGSVSGVTAGGAQVGATTSGNSQVFSPVTNYNTPDVQTVNQNVNQTGSLTTTTNGHTSSDNKTTNVNLVGGVTGQDVHYSGSYTVKNVPGLGNVNLTTSNDTCLGSWSAGIAVPGFGAQGGSTVVDENCVMLKNAREMRAMGLNAAAYALLCTNAANREAIRRSWRSDEDYLCPDDQEGRKQAKAAGQSGVAYVAPTADSIQPTVAGSTMAVHGRVVTVKPGWENANLADKAVFERMMASR